MNERIMAKRSSGVYHGVMKLCQGQLWKQEGEYIRIVRLERLEVEYKSMPALESREGTIHVATKKNFCRLIRKAVLVDRAEIQTPQPPQDPPAKKV